MLLDRATFKQIRDLLVPFMGSVADQRGFVDAAFFGTVIPQRVKFGDPADTFSVQLVRICQDHGMLDEHEHAMEALLTTLYTRVGYDSKQRIDIIREKIVIENEAPPAPPVPVEPQKPIATGDLIKQYYAAFKTGKWRQVLTLVETLEDRKDLPSFLTLDKQSVMDKITEIELRAARDHDYELLQLMAEHEPPERIWEALEKFLAQYPDFEPDDEMKAIAQTGFKAVRQAEYDQLKQLADSMTEEQLQQAAAAFAAQYPEFDLDKLFSEQTRPTPKKQTQAVEAVLEWNPDDTKPAPDEPTAPTETKEAGYERLRQMAETEPLADVADALQLFWDTHPFYDPDFLIFSRMQEHRGYQEALRRIEAAENSFNLDLSDLKIEVVPPIIVKLTHLRILRMWGGGVFRNVGKLTKLPESVTRLVDLTHLNIGQNQLETIPDSIGRLKNLTFLDISQNQLKTLPDSISNLKNLTVLEMYSNQFETLPASLFTLVELEKIVARDNQITEIPDEIAQLTALKQLYLYGNQLENLPIALGTLPHLETLDSGGNPRSQMPEEVVKGGNGAILAWLQEQAAPQAGEME